MGYYINSTGKSQLMAHEKAEGLVSDCGAERVQQPPDFDNIPEDKSLICVVNNGPFEAAGLIFSPDELNEFNRFDDIRPKTWLLMDKKLAHELSGYDEQ